MTFAATIPAPHVASQGTDGRYPGKRSVEPILKTENLWKLYHAGKVEVPALRGVNFEVQPANR